MDNLAIKEPPQPSDHTGLAAANSNQPPAPLILINGADDDVTRGDMAGYRGLGRIIAGKLGARLAYADISTLQQKYPIQQYGAVGYDQHLEWYLDEIGLPTMIIGTGCNDVLGRIGYDTKDTYWLTTINERLSTTLLKEDTLVSHHLTHEELEEEGRFFDETYPDIKKPLIAVFLVDPDNDAQINSFSRDLVSIASQYPDGATIFLCGSRRTDTQNYGKLKKKLEETVSLQQSNIDILGFPFHNTKMRNPYKGLIARSDHFVLWGESQSMLSEPLMSGKTVYLYNYPGSIRSAEKKGIVAQFNHCATDQPFPTRYFEPVNITERVADACIKEMEERRDSNASEPIAFTPAQMKPGWEEHLKKIRENYRYAECIPNDLKSNRDFALLATELRGFSIQYFDDNIRADENVARNAIRQNKDADRFVSPTVFESHSFILSIIERQPNIIDKLPEETLDDCDFMLSLVELNRDVYRYLPPHYQYNDRFALASIKNDKQGNAFLQLPRDLQIEADFVEQAMHTNPAIFTHLDEKFRGNKRLAMVAIKARVSFVFGSISENLLDNKRIFLALADHHSFDVSNIPPQLLKNKSFIRKLVRKNPGIYSSLPDEQRCDVKTARIASTKKNNILHFARGEAAQDYVVALNYAKHRPTEFPKMPEKHQKNPRFCRDVLKRNPDVYQHMGLAHKNRSLTLCAVQRDGKLLQYASDRIKRDKAVVAAAVKQDGRSLEHAAEKFYDHEDIILLASQTAPDALKLASDRLKSNPNFIRQLVIQTPQAIWQAEDSIRANIEFNIDLIVEHGFPVATMPCATSSEDAKEFCEALIERDNSYAEDATVKRLLKSGTRMQELRSRSHARSVTPTPSPQKIIDRFETKANLGKTCPPPHPDTTFHSQISGFYLYDHM